MSATSNIRRMFVRDAVLRVLGQCRSVWLLESTLMHQVNLTLQPAAGPVEISVALENLKGKGKVDFQVDEDDQTIRRWQITAAGEAQVP